MLTEKIKYTLFKNKINNSPIKKKLKIILNEDNEVLKSLGKNYQSSFIKWFRREGTLERLALWG